MTEFEEIESMKNSQEKIKKLKNFYNIKVKINDWLNNNSKIQIIHFKDAVTGAPIDLTKENIIVNKLLCGGETGIATMFSCAKYATIKFILKVNYLIKTNGQKLLLKK